MPASTRPSPRSSALLERRDHLEPLGREPAVRHPQAELRRALAGGDDEPDVLEQRLEVHVPDPRDVPAVGDRVVQRDDEDGRDAGLERPDDLVGPGRVLDQEQRRSTSRRPRSARSGRRRRRSARGRHGPPSSDAPTAGESREPRRRRCRRCRGRAARARSPPRPRRVSRREPRRVEPAQLDVPRGDVERGPRVPAARAAVVAEVADVGRGEVVRACRSEGSTSSRPRAAGAAGRGVGSSRPKRSAARRPSARSATTASSAFTTSVVSSGKALRRPRASARRRARARRSGRAGRGRGCRARRRAAAAARAPRAARPRRPRTGRDRLAAPRRARTRSPRAGSRRPGSTRGVVAAEDLRRHRGRRGLAVRRGDERRRPSARRARERVDRIRDRASRAAFPGSVVPPPRPTARESAPSPRAAVVSRLRRTPIARRAYRAGRRRELLWRTCRIRRTL